MNAQCYRVIFNKARGMLMVVSEAARAQGKTRNPAQGGSNISQVAGAPQTNSHYRGGRLITLRAQLLLALGLATLVVSSAGINQNAHADSTTIIADRQALANQQAVILSAANGTTQINIQSPSAAGVSRNVFSQFDVGSDGAIINNSRKNAQAQLAGWIEGNHYLARGEARVILNEVNSSDPSRLTGYTEIAGGKAELVIANPAGISCSGCGFINAARTTLTTGNALMDQGKLTGFDVTGGKVRIDGNGLDTTGANYTQIIAKTSEINAAIYANNLDVITGSNKVSYEPDAAATVITPKSVANLDNQATGAALDVSALGGMYAGKIRLIGTEKGMGVTNAGSIVASTGSLKLDSHGNLTNSGSLIANQGKVDIATKGFSINNLGTIASARDAAALNSNTLTNSGVISSQGALSLQQISAIDNLGEISSGSFDIKANALNNSGELLQTGSGQLAINTSALVNQQGGIIGQNLYADASIPPTVIPTKTPPTTANNGSTVDTMTGNAPSDSTSAPEPLPIITQDGRINTQSFTNTGRLHANGNINLAADTVVNQGKSSLALNRLDMANHGSLTNTDSRLQLENIDWQLATFDNQNGQIIATKDIAITSADQMNNNQGTIAALGNIALNAHNQIDNTQGSIQANGIITTQSSALDNTKGVLSSQENITLDNRGNLTNTKGRIQSDKNLTINAQGLSNTDGTIIGVNRVDINVFDDIAINSSSDDIQAGNLTLTTQGRFSNSGKLSGQNGLTVQAKRIDNQQGAELISNGATVLTAKTDINNQGLINGINTYLKADNNVNNSSRGRIYGDHVAIAAASLNNTPDSKEIAPIIAARARLDIGVTTLNNNPNQGRAGQFNTDFNGQARLLSNGDLYIGGSLDANMQATGRAATVTNKGASIESVGDMTISTDVLHNVNADFEKETVFVRGDKVVEYSPENQTTRYNKDDIEIYIHGWNDDWEQTLKTADGDYNNYEKFEFDAEFYKDETLSSDASLIRAGGNLSINSNHAINDHSLVVDGLTLSLKDDPTQTSRFGFQNVSSDGNETVNYVNSVYYSYTTRGKRRPDNITSKRPYTYTYGPYKVADESKVVNTYQLPILDQNLDKTVIAHDVENAVSQQITKAPTDEIRSSSDAPTLPNSSLYGINPDSKASYLIENDSAFANFDFLPSLKRGDSYS